MFRFALPSDIQALKSIYQKSVTELAPSLYTKEQVIAWSSFPDDTVKFTQFILKPDTYILENNQEIVGFCGLEKKWTYCFPLYSSCPHSSRIWH